MNFYFRLVKIFGNFDGSKADLVKNAVKNTSTGISTDWKRKQEATLIISFSG